MTGRSWRRQQDRKEVGKLGNVLMIALVWVSAYIGNRIMKKIQPESSRLYLVYTLSICVLITWFAIVYLSQA